MTKEVALSRLKPDEVGQPYIDVRAHRSFWESVERIASGQRAQLNSVLLDGNLVFANEVTRQGLEAIDNTKQFFNKEYGV